MAAVLIAAAVLLFPFAVRVVVHWDVKEGKTGFAAYLYGVLRVAGGYAAPYGGGIAVHLGKKTALLLPYTQLLFSRSRFALMRGFSLCSLRQIVKIGGGEDPARALAACLLWRKALDAAFFAVGRRKDVRLAGDILLDEEGQGIRVTADGLVVFSLLALMTAAVKLFLEKIHEYTKKRNKRSYRGAD